MRPSAVDWLKYGRILEISLGTDSRAVSGDGDCYGTERQPGRPVQFDGGAVE